ncbi:hypothetical protein LOD99_1212 [Oopsacas minuta]|uniref:SAM domain-containing protein n=1 Tax=Oopsacas minuta TaxID=111878 RepID=A0AAV7K621_9METZ|nr:hypothetical protein LOD99_1212 [Oopsacas minuta]
MEADGDRYSEPKTILQQSENKPIKQLDDYSVQDVKELLNSLNLSQYTNKFVEEGVNGEILSVLDSSILENDLGITSGLHKKKILKIVEKLIHQQDISHYMCLDSFRVPPAASEDVYQEL